MLDLTKAIRIWVNGKPVKSLSIGDTTPIWIDDKFVNFTLLDNFKVKVGLNEVEEIYNLSYDISSRTPHYAGNVRFTDGNNTVYYLTTVSQKDKGSIKDPLKNVYYSSGWYSDTNQDGEEYYLWEGNYYRNITLKQYFGYDIKSTLAKYPIDKRWLTEAIRRVNCTFPSAHVKLTDDEDCANFFEMDDYEDTWLALCTCYYDHVRIQFNYGNMTDYYGTFYYNPQSTTYKKWLGTAVHELGHTFGPRDQATHYPSIYDYSRDRTKALYLQSNDIAWIKHAYCDLRGCDPSIFDVDRKNADAAHEETRPARMAARLAPAPIPEGSDMNFDYFDFNSDTDLEGMASNIVTATLTFSRTETIKIGTTLEMEYNVYFINIINEEKGTLTKKELKIQPSIDKIKENQRYRLYLKEYEKTPCSLISVEHGLVEI